MNTSNTSLLSRRQTLGFLAAFGAIAAACGSEAVKTATTTATPSAPDPTTAVDATLADATAATGVTGGTTTPDETGGPFPSDGSNDNGEGQTANVLADPRSVRQDIRADLDGGNVQEGAPFTLAMNVVSPDGAPLAGAAVYVWHASREGIYSQYNSNMLGGDYTDFSWLRGVQITDAKGAVNFTSVFPGRYQGRAFHIHFEVFSDSSYGTKLLTSQMAMDDDAVDAIYAAASGYETSARNDTDNANDNVFSDGVDDQLMSVTGDAASGITGSFTAVV